MHIDKLIKKQVSLIFVTIVVATIIVISSSYALFTKTFETETQSLNIGNLSVSFSNGSGGELTSSNAINLNASPMTDIEATASGYNNDLYAFVITNNGTVAYEYTIQIIDDPTYLSGGANYNASRIMLDKSYIKYKLNNEEIDYLSNKTNGFLYSGTINPNQTQNFTLRMWVSWQNNAEQMILDNAIGSEAHLNIIIDGEAGEEVS